MKYIQIVSLETAEVIKQIDVTGKLESEVLKIERGIMINLDHERFFIDEIE